MRRRLAQQGFGADQGFRTLTGGPDAAGFSGMAYMPIWPLQVLDGRIMRPRIRQAADAG